MSFFPRDVGAPAAGPAIIWEEPACLLCGQRKAEPLVEAPDSTAGGTGFWFAAVQCQECGLCFTSPRPSAECMDQFYPKDYRPHRLRHRRAASPISRLGQAWHQPRKEYQTVGRRGRGRLLDFGCGGGSFLLKMRDLSWHGTGLDTSPAAVERVRHLGLPAFVGSLPHPDLKPEIFDLITM